MSEPIERQKRILVVAIHPDRLGLRTQAIVDAARAIGMHVDVIKTTDLKNGSELSFLSINEDGIIPA